MTDKAKIRDIKSYCESREEEKLKFEKEKYYTSHKSSDEDAVG